MNRSRVAMIAVVAVVVFGAAFLLFRGDDGDSVPTETAGGSSGQTTPTTVAAGACTTDVKADAAYAISYSTPPKVDGTSFEVLITRNGTPVTGAKLCISADMVGMSHPAVGGQATELANGKYRFAAKFGMRGGWQGALTVVPKSGAAVSIPVAFDVT